MKRETVLMLLIKPTAGEWLLLRKQSIILRMAIFLVLVFNYKKPKDAPLKIYRLKSVTTKSTS